MGIALAGAPAGCTTWWSLPEVPILGGTSAERRLVRSELIAFDQAVGEGRVRIASFEFGRLDGAYGRIRAGRRITVEPGLVADFLTRVVRHELCHALDRQEHLTDDAPPALAALVSDLQDAYVDAKPVIKEVLAHYCQSGPYAAQILAEPCPGDDPRGTALTSWLMDHVWTAYDAATHETGPSVGRDLGPDVATYELFPHRDPVDVALLAYGEDPSRYIHIDLNDGSTTERDGLPVEAFGSVQQFPPDPPVVPAMDLFSGSNHNGVGFRGGPWVGAYYVGFDSFMLDSQDTIDISAPRILGWDGEAWWMPTDRCLRPGQGVFATQDRVFWSSWIEGTELRWAPFLPIGAD